MKTAFIIIDVQNILVETGFQTNSLLEKMAELLPEKRLTHCLGVERAAIELAHRFAVDS